VGLPRCHGAANGRWRYDIDGDGRTIRHAWLRYVGRHDYVANAMVTFDLSAHVHHVVSHDDRYDDSKRGTNDPAFCV